MNLIFVVPRGAEANAIRRAAPHARIVATAAGAMAAAALPPFPPGDTVVVFGLCGALRTRTVGDVVVYREIAGDAEDDQHVRLDLCLLTAHRCSSLSCSSEDQLHDRTDTHRHDQRTQGWHGKPPASQRATI